MLRIADSRGRSALLTGDIEAPQEAALLQRQREGSGPPLASSVLLVPHHGSKTSNKFELAQWANPQVAISSQGPPRGNPKTANPYEPAGAAYLTTWKHGAVTIRKEQGQWIVETYRTKKKIALK